MPKPPGGRLLRKWRLRKKFYAWMRDMMGATSRRTDLRNQRHRREVEESP